jgi:hypothetical protein
MSSFHSSWFNHLNNITYQQCKLVSLLCNFLHLSLLGPNILHNNSCVCGGREMYIMNEAYLSRPLSPSRHGSWHKKNILHTVLTIKWLTIDWSKGLDCRDQYLDFSLDLLLMQWWRSFNGNSFNMLQKFSYLYLLSSFSPCSCPQIFVCLSSLFSSFHPTSPLSQAIYAKTTTTVENIGHASDHVISSFASGPRFSFFTANTHTHTHTHTPTGFVITDDVNIYTCVAVWCIDTITLLTPSIMYWE